MKFSVEAWAAEYGTPAEDRLREVETPPDVGIEVPASEWMPVAPAADPVGDVLFVDGVRRVDASVWIEQRNGYPALGLCAVYAAGAVRSMEGRADVVDAEVRRGLFTSASGASDVSTRHAEYRLMATEGDAPEELWLGIQQRMGELEGEVAARNGDAGILVVDGPLSHRRHARGAVGYVKTQHVRYLPEEVAGILPALPVGRRTPLFLTTTAWSRFSWYLRLAPGAGPLGGIVRCEIVADHPVADAARIADRVTATLPRFASDPHKDPRAPQNLYPIAGLERALRRRLGDQRLMYRALRDAAGAV